MFSAVPAAQAGSGSHTSWYINPSYIDPEDWKSWKASMSKEDWEQWQKSISPEQWEAWQASNKPDSQPAATNSTSDKYQEADIQADHWH
jgi:hypothetical protein